MSKLICGFLLYLVLVTLPSKVMTASLPESLTLAIEPEDYRHTSHLDPNTFTLAFIGSLDTELKTFSCPWARCLRAAQNGEIDLLNHLYLTPERQTFLTYLYPPYAKQIANFRFWTHKNYPSDITTYEETKKLRFAIIRGNTYYSALRKDANPDNIVVLTEQQMIDLVLRQRADAFIAPPSLTDQMIAQYDTDGLLKKQSFSITEEKGVYLAVPKASPWNAHVETLSKQLGLFLATEKTGKH